MTRRIDIRIGDALTREPTADVLAELAEHGLAVERPDPTRTVWLVVESEAAREERRRAAALPASLFGPAPPSQLERAVLAYIEELPRTRSRSRAMRRAAARVRRDSTPPEAA